MRPKRKPMGGGAVAFIDVMACGLGAVVLLLVIVDFNITEIIPQLPNRAAPNSTVTPNTSKEDLEARLKSIQANNVELAASVAELTEDFVEKEFKRDSLQASLNERPANPAPESKVNKPGQLIGLQVDGQSIVILLDRSGSMYSDILADNVYYAVSPSKTQSDRSAKWSQARRIAKWLIDVAPNSSVIKLATFAEKVQPVSQGWQKKSVLSPAVEVALDSMIPESGTDLQVALNWLAWNANQGTQAFLITDGLPTKLSKQGMVSRLISACARDPKGYVGGECRQQIFSKSITAVANASLELNVIFLPLEGDPLAAPQYWSLARSKGGLLFVPEQSWP